MLQAVEADSQRYEGLYNHITKNKRSPTQFENVRVRPRLENSPGQPIPNISGKIKASSQRPGKRTNDTIVYTRIVFTEFKNSAVPSSDVLPGDLVMLHKTRGGYGYDTSRTTVVASWRQIDALLQNREDNALLTSSMKQSIIFHRELTIRALRSQAELLRKEIDFRKGYVNTRFENELSTVEGEYLMLENQTEMLKKEAESAVFLLQYDWPAVPLLGNWTLDGVLVSRDDDEQNASPFHAGAGESGVAMNVALHGPASTRNCTKSKIDTKHLEFVQIFDPVPQVLDELYLCVVAEKQTNTNGSFKGFGFALKTTSRRILEQLGEGFWQSNPAKGCCSEHGMTANQASNVVFAWKVGTVMDNLESALSDKKVKVNVSVRPLCLRSLRLKFGDHVGKALLDEETFVFNQ